MIRLTLEGMGTWANSDEPESEEDYRRAPKWLCLSQAKGVS
jgi:hypothetical protein